MKNLKIIFALFVLLAPTSAMAATYYVSTSGSYGAACTEGAPCTIEKINDSWGTISDGDSIALKAGDRWTSGEAIGNGQTVSGEKTITITRYGTGADPVIDCDNLRAVNIEGNGAGLSLIVEYLSIEGIGYGNYLFQIGGVDNLTIRYCNIDGHLNSAGNDPHTAMGIFRIEGLFEMYGNQIQNIYNESTGISGTFDLHSLYLSYSVPGGSSTGRYLIHDNIFIGVQADHIQMKGYNAPSGGQWNEIYNNYFALYGENSIDFKNSSKTKVHNNIFSHSNGNLANNPKAGTGGNIADVITHSNSTNYGDDCDSIWVYDNTFYRSHNGAVSFAQSTNCIMEYNTLIDYGRMFKASDMVNVVCRYNRYCNRSSTNTTTELSVVRIYYNNIDNLIFAHNSIYEWSGSNNTRVISFETDSAQSGNVITRNVIVTENGVVPITVEIRDGDSTPTINNNALYSSGSTFVSYKGTTYSSAQEATWIAAGHANSNFMSGVPFADEDNYNLTPATGNDIIDSVTSYGTGYTDGINHDQSIPLPAETNTPTTVRADQASYGSGFEPGAVVYGTSGGGGDTTPAVISNFSPSSTLPGATTQTTVTVTTNEPATCQHNETGGIAFDGVGQTEFTSTGGTTHSYTKTGLTPDSNVPIYIRCEDTANNVNTSDFVGVVRTGPLDNLLVGAYYSHTGDLDPAYAIDNLTDGDYTNPTGSAGSGTNADLEVIYDAGVSIDWTDFDVFGDNTNNWFCYTYDVDVSDNLSDWTNVIDDEDCFVFDWTNPSMSPESGRYVRFTFVGNKGQIPPDRQGYTALQVVEVYGTGTPTQQGGGGGNVSIGAKNLHIVDGAKSVQLIEGVKHQ